jgi:DNA-binding MarR family transcriptional regulator
MPPRPSIPTRSKTAKRRNSSPPQQRDHIAPPLDQRELLGLVGYNLRRAYLPILSLFRERMAKLNLSPVDYTVLILVRANPNVNQKRLGRTLGIDPPNMATLLDRLEKRKLVARARNPADLRAQHLLLTLQGRALCGAAEKVVRKLEVDATSRLTRSERTELMRLAQKIFQH